MLKETIKAQYVLLNISLIEVWLQLLILQLALAVLSPAVAWKCECVCVDTEHPVTSQSCAASCCQLVTRFGFRTET